MRDENLIFWNEQQKQLEAALKKPSEHAQAVELFLAQHAMVHSARMEESGLYSFEDAVWEGLSESGARRVPKGALHSIVWLMWHAARCEDITFNLLAAGDDQVLLSGGWLEAICVPARDTGNAMSESEIAQFSAEIDIPALQGYCDAVGRKTRAVVRSVAPGGFKQLVPQERVPRILAEGAVVAAASGLVDYWASRTIGGLMLMPGTRHHVVHLNEAMRQKKKK